MLETSNETHLECRHIGGVSRGERLRPTRGEKHVRRGERQMEQGVRSKDTEALTGQVQQVTVSIWRARQQGSHPRQQTSQWKGLQDVPHAPIKVARPEKALGRDINRTMHTPETNRPRGPCAHCQAVRVDYLLPFDTPSVLRERLICTYHGSRRGRTEVNLVVGRTERFLQTVSLQNPYVRQHLSAAIRQRPI